MWCSPADRRTAQQPSSPLGQPRHLGALVVGVEMWGKDVWNRQGASIGHDSAIRAAIAVGGLE
jgi:hypothetical protein